jgi:hypothetical protein
MSTPKKEQKGHRRDGTVGGKTYCSYCGLIFLNNEASRKQANKPCE